MAKKTHIQVKVSVAEIRSSLRKRITSEHADLITDVIMGNLEKSEVGYDQLYMALSGVQEKLWFQAGDHVVVMLDHLSSWKFNKAKSIEAGLVRQGKVKGRILEADIFAKYPYHVTTAMINDQGETVDVASSVGAEAVYQQDEWPNPESDVKEDLPF